ncbi:MAG: hypothetical protein V3T31_06855 [candidate division Zixibacteria bacterium]
MKKTLLVLGAGLIMACLVWTGCSEQTNSVAGTGSSFESSPAVANFPVGTGYTTTYSVTTADGGQDIVSYEVGAQTRVQGLDAYAWTVSYGNGRTSVGYLVVTDSALFFLSSASATPERVLSLPLSPGSSWSRSDITGLFDEVDTQGGGNEPDAKDEEEDDGLDGGTDGKDNGDLPDDGDDPNSSPTVSSRGFPTSGNATMTVLSGGTVTLDNGSRYNGVLWITNQSYDGKRNYYWYAQGVGMVKYVLGANSGDPYHGDEVGELVQSGVLSR